MSKITHIRVLAFSVAPVVLYLDIKLRMLWYRSFTFTPEVMIEGTERRFVSIGGHLEFLAASYRSIEARLAALWRELLFRIEHVVSCR